MTDIDHTKKRMFQIEILVLH